MGLLQRLLGRAPTTDSEKDAELARLDARRRHLRGKLSQTSTKIRHAWSEFRTWRGDEKGKKAVKLRIKHLEAERKALVKEMMKVQARMTKLGAKAKAGHVEMH